jgi:hypothetical protein
MQGDEARLELGSFCQKWGVRSSYVLSSSSLTTCVIPNSGGLTGSQRNVVMCA